MNQRQEELQRRNNEVEAVKENLSSQLELVEKKKQDLDKLHQKEVELWRLSPGCPPRKPKSV